MPGNIVTLPTVQNTGLQSLGNALLQGSGNYAQLAIMRQENDRIRQQALEDEARRRQQQLQDVSSARTAKLQDVESSREYAGSVFDKERAARMQDVEAEKLFAINAELVRLGYLMPGDIRNPEAVKAAILKANQDGMVKRYQGAISTGDLTYDDLMSGDSKRINEGLAKFSSRLGKQTEEIETNKEAVRKKLNEIATQQKAVQKDMDVLDNELATPVPQPTARQIEELAFAPGEKAKLKPEEIAKRTSEAAATLAQSAWNQWKEHHDSAIIRRQLLSARMSDLTKYADVLTNKTGAVGFAEEPTQVPANITTPAAQPAVGEDFFAMAARAAKAKRAVESPSAAAPAVQANVLPNAANEPLIQAENTRRIGQNWQQNLADPFNVAMDRVQEASRKVAELRTSQSQPTLPQGTYPGVSMSQPMSQATRAKLLSDALTELDAAKQQAEKARRAMLNVQDPGVAAATPVSALPMTNALGSTPFPANTTPQWWQGGLSQAY